MIYLKNEHFLSTTATITIRQTIVLNHIQLNKIVILTILPLKILVAVRLVV